jgi:hypothetical protein
MSDRVSINKWVDLENRDGITVFAIRGGDDASFFDSAATIADQVIAKYEEVAPTAAGPSCIVLVEVSIAPSPVIRLLYRLFKACRKRGGTTYVCNFPEEYMVSLSTLALTEQPGFRLRPNVEMAIDDIRAETVGG